MDSAIQKEISALQITPSDEINGMVHLVWPGVTENIFRRFQGNALRILTSWEVTGTAIHEDPARSFPFSISLDDEEERITFQFHLYQFSAPTAGGAIRVVNSSGTGELLIRCLQDLRINTPRPTHFKAGSMIYIKDSAPNP